MSGLWGADPLVCGLCRPGRPAESGGTDHGGRAGASLLRQRYAARECAPLCLPPEWQSVHAHAEAALALATAYGFARVAAQGTLFRGRALAAQGQHREGLTQMQQGLAAHRATGTVIGLPFWLAQLAEAYGQAGQVEAGVPLLVDALAVVDKTGVRASAAELHRLRGALLLQQPVPETQAAAACFQQALTVARRQQAKAWELRAATSLARLWQQQGKRAAAYALLAPIYGWFTEGLDTADLQEAKALLEELGG